MASAPALTSAISRSGVTAKRVRYRGCAWRWNWRELVVLASRADTGDWILFLSAWMRVRVRTALVRLQSRIDVDVRGFTPAGSNEDRNLQSSRSS